MRSSVRQKLPVLFWTRFMIYLCARASTVVQIVDTSVPDLLPTFSSEGASPKYVVALQDARAVGGEGALPMKDKYGRPYSCSIPDTTQHDEEAQGASPKDDQQTTQKSLSELLSALDSLCLYRVEDWWTYELCYKKHVRQFHKEVEKVISEYDLGQYNDEGSDLDAILDNSTLSGVSSRYVRQVYSGGEACDITGKRRETEVHFVCSEEGKEGIKSIREHATCQYTLVFASPRVCKHPGFQIPKQPVHTIVCGRLGGSQQTDEEMPAQHHVVKEQATEEVPLAGSEGATIEGGLKGVAPVVLDGGALEGILDLTQASQDGILNTSALEAAFAKAGREVEAELDRVKRHSGHKGDQSEGLEEAQAGLGGHQNSEGDIQYGRMQDSRGPVGPPSPANFKAAAEALYYEEDEAADEEADKEDEDDQDFSRTGMHAEL